MIILVPLAASLVLLTQADQSNLLGRLERLDDAGATRVISSERAAARQLLDELMERVDASVHSDRQKPEQRRVRYDAEALTSGLRIGRLYGRATADRSYSGRFEARKQRLQGTELLNERRYREALKPLTAALAAAQALDDKWLQAITRVNLAYGHLELGHGQEALAQSEQAAEIASTLGDRARGLTLYNLASVHLHLKNFAQSIGYSAQAVAVSRTAGNKLWEGNSLINIGAARQALGDLQAAEGAFLSALEVLETTRDRIGPGRALYNLGMVKLNQGRSAEAAAYLERALPIIRSADIRHSHEIELQAERYQNPIEVATLQALIEIYSETGDKARADAHLTALREIRSRAKPAHVHKTPHE